MGGRVAKASTKKASGKNPPDDATPKKALAFTLSLGQRKKRIAGDQGVKRMNVVLGFLSIEATGEEKKACASIRGGRLSDL